MAELAVNAVGLGPFQLRVRDLFKDFQPAWHHLLISRFRWHAIVTTNVDLVIERAYEQAPQSHGELVVWLKDGQLFDLEMKQVVNAVPLIKLHGCVNHYLDTDIPFILAKEQYARYSRNRRKLFSRFRDLGEQFPILFAGYSISDPHIQGILFDIFDLEIARPMYYVALPSIDPIEAEYWSSKRITPLQASLEELLQALAEAIPEHSGAVPAYIGGGTASIRTHYRTPGIVESLPVLSFLENDVEHVRPGMPVLGTASRAFYFGDDQAWAAIAGNFDVRRRISDSIMLDAILTEEQDRLNCSDLYVLKGPAGNGKSIILKRLAWDAAHEFGKLVLFAKPNGALRTDALFEISNYTQERVFVFVDRAALAIKDIRDLLRLARAKRFRITFVTAERDNEWNVRCDDLEEYVERDYPVKYLSEKEIEELLAKLEEHDALGVLKEARHQDRVRAFVESAERQLLVALHEATHGRRFEEILLDEYDRIIPLEARQLYLDVCTLNRLGVGVRAGLISRVSGIRFEDFGSKLLRPLEHVVLSYRDTYADDMMYRARHAHVAEIVFFSALASEEERYDQMMNILSGMNIGYSSDMEAFRQMTQARRVIDTFRQSLSLGRSFYEAAEEQAGRSNAYLYQQRAIFEMRHPDGELALAEKALEKALEIAPHDRSIRHSSAALAREQAQAASNPLLRQNYRRTARQRLEAVTGAASRRPHGFHTAALLCLDDIRDHLENRGEEAEEKGADRPLVTLSRNFELVISRGLQKFPDDPYLLQLQAEYLDLMSQHRRAEEALRIAFERNPKEDWIAVLLARRLSREGRDNEAKEVLRRALGATPDSKQVHLALAHAHMRGGNEQERASVLGHLAASFIDGDSNYDAQFWFARELFLRGEVERSRAYFQKLYNGPHNLDVRQQVRGIVRDEEGTPKRLPGIIVKKETSYLFLRPVDFNADVYADVRVTPDAVWDSLKQGTRVSFELGFSMKGPIARAIRLAKV